MRCESSVTGVIPARPAFLTAPALRSWWRWPAPPFSRSSVSFPPRLRALRRRAPRLPPPRPSPPRLQVPRRPGRLPTPGGAGAISQPVSAAATAQAATQGVPLPAIPVVDRSHTAGQDPAVLLAHAIALLGAGAQAAPLQTSLSGLQANVTGDTVTAAQASAAATAADERAGKAALAANQLRRQRLVPRWCPAVRHPLAVHDRAACRPLCRSWPRRQRRRVRRRPESPASSWPCRPVGCSPGSEARCGLG